MNTRIRLLLADDHPPLRAGLAAIFQAQPDFQIVAEAGSGAEAVALAAREKPDVCILDLRMPGGDGVEATRRLVAQDPGARVLILTTYDLEEDIFRALEAGARGYLLKDATSEELLAAVRLIHKGERHLPPAIAARLAERLIRTALTPREMDVLRLVARGRSNKEIATAMFVTEETVKTHVKALFLKLGVHDRAEAVTVAAQRGLLRL
jgi:two-component system NarL family response regulator